MDPGERIAAIRRISNRLGAEDSWADVDLILESFGMPVRDEWDNNDKESYVRAMIRHAEDKKLGDLDRYLVEQGSADEVQWEEGHFRLFLTHLAAHKKWAHELKSALHMHGVDAFVAHDDIEPGKKWQHEIELRLVSCDALAALLHKGFKESNWCAQEVGFVLGRGLPVVPVKFDLDPYGFFGAVQALPGGTVEPKVVARRIVDVLLSDKRTGDRLREALVQALEGAGSFNQAKVLARLLAEEPHKVTPDQLQRLRKAQKENSQVAEAYGVEASLSAIEAVVTVATPMAAPPLRLRRVGGGYAYDEEPF